MTILRAIVAGIVVVFAAYVAVMNWWCVIASEVNRRKGVDRHHSPVPGISLLLVAAVGYPMWPHGVKWWMWVIPAVDIGTWMLIVVLPWAIATGAFKRKSAEDESEPTQQGQ